MPPNKPELFLSLHFRPVGQGLFAHGNLQHIEHQENNQAKVSSKYEWVYDCGSENPGAHLLPQITAYELHNSDVLELLVLSHFDKDHVIGIEQLLKNRKPRILVAPYLTLDQRLELLAGLNTTEIEYARFLLEPASTLRRYAGDNARLVFVAPGGERPPERSEGDNANPNRPWPPTDKDLKGRRDSPSNITGDLDPDSNARRDPNTHIIDGGTPLLLWNLWEFCFFNLPRPDMQPNLWPLVKDALTDFQGTNKNAADYVALIAQLREVFESVRGTGSHPRRFYANEISVVMYSGPIHRDGRKCTTDATPWITPTQLDSRVTKLAPGHWPPPFPTRQGQCAALFTGDLTLDDHAFDEIQKQFGSDRLKFVSTFQVPHHGSKKSFQLSAASDFSPRTSVFSSAHYHTKYDHPNEGVIDALKANGPVFVNEFQGVSIGGFIER